MHRITNEHERKVRSRWEVDEVTVTSVTRGFLRELHICSFLCLFERKSFCLSLSILQNHVQSISYDFD